MYIHVNWFSPGFLFTRTQKSWTWTSLAVKDTLSQRSLPPSVATAVGLPAVWMFQKSFQFMFLNFWLTSRKSSCFVLIDKFVSWFFVGKASGKILTPRPGGMPCGCARLRHLSRSCFCNEATGCGSARGGAAKWKIVSQSEPFFSATKKKPHRWHVFCLAGCSTLHLGNHWNHIFFHKKILYRK